MAELDPKVLYNRSLDGHWAPLPYIDYEVRKDAFDEVAARHGQKFGTAYQFYDKKPVPVLYISQKDRDFKSYATPWEIHHSNLVFGERGGEPIVDHGMTVIAHFDWFDSREIYVSGKALKAVRRVSSGSRGEMLLAILNAGGEVYADKWNSSYYTKQGYSTYNDLWPDSAVRAVVNPEGRLLFFTDTVTEGGGLKSSWVSPLDLISIVKLVSLVGTAAVGLAIRIAIRKAMISSVRTGLNELTSATVRELTSGASREGAEDLAREEALAAERAAAGRGGGGGAGGGGRGGGGAGGGGRRVTLRGVGIAAREPFRRRAGQLSADEMQAYLREVLGNRPDLRRLMAARVMTGQGRMDAIQFALKEFERTQGWTVVEKSAAEMEAAGIARDNIVSMRAQARELWINNERAARFDPNAFYEHVVHDLSAHALVGRGGTLGPEVLPFIGDYFTRFNNGLAILEHAIKTGDLEKVVASFRSVPD